MSKFNDDCIRLKVLQHNNIDSSYVFGSWDELESNETHLRHLGVLIGEKNSYKIITSYSI